MDYSNYKEAFDREGFVRIRRFLDEAELAELRRELDRYISQVVPTLSDAHAFYQDKSRPETLKQMQFMGVDPYFKACGSHPKFQGLAVALIGEQAVCDDPEWFNKPPATEHPTPPHQDNYYFNLVPPHVITIWVALEEIDEENGCLRYVSGSHLQGRRTHATSKVLGFSQGITDFGDQDRAREVQMHLQPGDAIVHHGWTIHRAEPNRSQTRHRRAFAMVFKGVSCERDEEGFRIYQQSAKAQHSAMGLKT